MDHISFDDYCYFPSLRTRVAELRGLEMLKAEEKENILPILMLGEWPRAKDFERSYSAAAEAMEGLPFFIDITRDPTRIKEQRRSLLSHSDDFSSWIDFATGCENTIPIVLLVNNPPKRETIRQVRKMEQKIGRLAIRIRNFNTEPDLAVSALSAMDDPNNAMIFFDAQYIRGSLQTKIEKVRLALDAVRREFPEPHMCVLGTSFPRSVVPHMNEQATEGSLKILERSLYGALIDEYDVQYGDHGSVHSTIYDDKPGIRRTVPRIDYPLLDSWSVQRRNDAPSNKEGYQRCAHALLEKHACIDANNSWGERMIVEAVTDPFNADAQSWIAVRVNAHIAKQLKECLRFREEGWD